MHARSYGITMQVRYGLHEWRTSRLHEVCPGHDREISWNCSLWTVVPLFKIVRSRKPARTLCPLFLLVGKHTRTLKLHLVCACCGGRESVQTTMRVANLRGECLIQCIPHEDERARKNKNTPVETMKTTIKRTAGDIKSPENSTVWRTDLL